MRSNTYEIVIDGVLPETARAELPGLRVVVGEHRTLLVGEFVDQAALHGFLDRIKLLGLSLLEVRVAGERSPDT